MVDRVLEKTNVNAHPFTLVLSARGRDWELKRTQHQTPRQFSTPAIVRAAVRTGSSPLERQPRPKLTVI